MAGHQIENVLHELVLYGTLTLLQDFQTLFVLGVCVIWDKEIVPFGPILHSPKQCLMNQRTLKPFQRCSIKTICLLLALLCLWQAEPIRWGGMMSASSLSLSSVNFCLKSLLLQVYWPDLFQTLQHNGRHNGLQLYGEIFQFFSKFKL